MEHADWIQLAMTLATAVLSFFGSRSGAKSGVKRANRDR